MICFWYLKYENKEYFLDKIKSFSFDIIWYLNLIKLILKKKETLNIDFLINNISFPYNLCDSRDYK